MTDYSFGEILLLRFPYSEGVGEARRPAVVLAQTDIEDIVVSKVTSVEQRGKYDIVIEDWQRAGLILPSVVRIDKLATLSKSRVIRRLGQLHNSYHPMLKANLKELFNIE